MPDLIYPKLSNTIISAYFDVYNTLGTEYPEAIYQNALRIALEDCHLKAKREVEHKIYYEEHYVGTHILDLTVEDKITLEVKVKKKLTKLHKAQLISYLKATDHKLAFLMNFGSNTPEFEAVPNKIPKQSSSQTNKKVDDRPDIPFAKLRYELIGAGFKVYNVLGTGYVFRIYSNAYNYELKKHNIAFQPFRKLEVHFHNRKAGEVTYHHFLIEDKVVVFTTTVDDFSQIDQNAFKRCLKQHCVKHGIILNFQGTSLSRYYLDIEP